MSATALEWRRVAPDLEQPLAAFFSSIDADDEKFFHPHAFDAAQAKRISSYAGQDLYYVLVEGVTVLAYGILRGWDEGFAVPSLGIVVAREARGSGVSTLVMNLLHMAARRRGAPRVRLKVFEENASALALYQSLGYQFASREQGQLVGLLEPPLTVLKICIEARLHEGTAGGGQQVLIGLASGLARLSDGDEEYHFLVHESGSDWLVRYLAGPCRAVRMPAPPPPRWASLRSRLKRIESLRRGVIALRRKLASSNGPVPIPPPDDLPLRLGAEVMHFPFQFAYPVPIPSIYHPHDLQHLHLPQFFTPADIRHREATYRYFCDRAALVAVTSTWIKRDLVAQYRLPEERIAVIPLAPVLESYPDPDAAETAEVVAKFRLPAAFGLYPAQTWPHKNHIGLLRALKEVRDRTGQAIPFVFSGFKNDHFRNIERVVTELGLGDHVNFVGFVSPSELRVLYRLARCVVIPTKFEAASFPLWEAFIAGTPAACSNVTSLPEQAGDAALIFDPDSPTQMADRIAELWSDASLRRTLVERGKVRVASFTWDRTARTFRAHYRRLAGRVLSAEDEALIARAPSL